MKKATILVGIIILCLANIVDAGGVTTTQTDINFVAGASFDVNYTLQFDNPNPSVCQVSANVSPDGIGFVLSYVQGFVIHQGTSTFTINIDTDYRLAPGIYTLTVTFISESLEPVIIEEIKIVNVPYELIKTVYVNSTITIPGENTTKYINNTVYQDKIITNEPSLLDRIGYGAIGAITAIIVLYIIYRMKKRGKNHEKNK